MKTIKMIALVVILALTSCEQEVAPDCNCDRVMDPISQINIAGYGSVGGYKTKNDCTGEINIHQYTGIAPRVGSCK